MSPTPAITKKPAVSKKSKIQRARLIRLLADCREKAVLRDEAEAKAVAEQRSKEIPHRNSCALQVRREEDKLKDEEGRRGRIRDESAEQKEAREAAEEEDREVLGEITRRQQDRQPADSRIPRIDWEQHLALVRMGILPPE